MSKHKHFKKNQLALSIGLLLTTQAQATTINVDGTCSLIDAINTANSDLLVNACEVGSGADTIELPANGTITLTTTNNVGYNGDNGLPIVDSEITIAGNGATILRNSVQDFRILEIDFPGDLTLQQTTISGGSTYVGGGIYNIGVLVVDESTISGNTAVFGGGFAQITSGISTINNSTISGNTAVFWGGGILSYLTYTNSTTINNSTISGNMSSYEAGGLMAVGSGIDVNHSTIADNTATIYGNGVSTYYGGYISLSSTILNNGGTECEESYYNTVANLGNNWVSDTSCDNIPMGTGSINLGGLIDNGGPTLTHALLAGSAAIDAFAPDGACTSDFDQRGVARPQGAACDIGAFEVAVIDISDIIDFFETELGEGGLVGLSSAKNNNGKGKGKNDHDKPAEARANAFANQLDALEAYIEQDDTEAACDQIESILKRIHTGGQQRPDHFIGGESADELEAMLLALQDELGCND